MINVNFLGWPPLGSYRQPSNHLGQDCISLARRFYDHHRHIKDVKYYYWNDAPCTVQLPFICEKIASSQGTFETANKM